MANSIQILSFFIVILSFIFYFTSGLSHQGSSFSIRASASTSTTKLALSSVPIIEKHQFHPQTHYYHTINNNDDDEMKSTTIGACNTSTSAGTKTFETPVLVSGVLSQQTCESMCDIIIQELGDSTVDLQRKTRYLVLDQDEEYVMDNGKIMTETEVDTIKCPLRDAFQYIMESHHDDSFFSFCEGLLDDEKNGSNDKLQQLKQDLQSAKESLFCPSNNGNEDDGDLFEFFPNDKKPSDCVIFAGEGATSTLHRDPFCWTGTSLCLEGTKVWRFIAPPGVNLESALLNNDDSCVQFVDNAVKSYRLPSVAWDGDLYLSSGWQSDMSLYEERNEDIPSAQQLAELEETNIDRKSKLLNDIASSLDNLKPSIDFPSELSTNRDGDTLPLKVWSVVQKPGDLLIIPAFWWHQTYALEPSVAVASQRAGYERDRKRVLSHIFDTIGLHSENEWNSLPLNLKRVLEDEGRSIPQKEVAAELFLLLSQHSK